MGRNRIRCETYLYRTQLKPQAVFVGSSLTDNLSPQEIDDRVFNLGIVGGSLWTGLEVVRTRSDYHPPALVLEVSEFLLREPNDQIVRSISNPVSRTFRGLLPMLRQEYQPMNVFVGVLSRLRRGGQRTPPAVVVPELQERLVGEARTQADRGLSEEEKVNYREICRRLRTRIKEFEALGTRCFLHQIPGEASLESTAAHRELIALFAEEFPAERETWVPPLPGFAGRTRDAVHLIEEDAATYARHVCAAVLPPR